MTLTIFGHTVAPEAESVRAAVRAEKVQENRAKMAKAKTKALAALKKAKDLRVAKSFEAEAPEQEHA